MAQSDQISLVLSETELAAIKQAIAVLKTTLVPKLTVLAPQTKYELPKMGERTVSFVQKSLEYSQKRNDLVPPFLDIAAFQTDVDAIKILRDIQTDLAPLHEAVDDSLTLAGSEAYQAALIFYGSARNATKQKIAGAASVYEDLATRFPGAPSKKATSPATK